MTSWDEENLRTILRRAQTIAEGPLDYVRKCNGLSPFDILRLCPESLGEYGTSMRPIGESRSFLFSEWRFATAAKNTLIAHLISSRSTCLLGASSLSAGGKIALSFSQTAGPNEPSLVADINSLTGREFPGRFEYVVLDPPWYMPTILHWLSIASNYCSVGGTILFPMFRSLTRPSAEAETKLLKDLVMQFGELHVFPDAIIYETPSFEAAILNRLSINYGDWRIADLWQITKREADSKLSRFQGSANTPLVLRKELLGINVEIKVDRYDRGRQLFALSGSDSFMNSTSMRDPKNLDANLFTSNGFCLSCWDPFQFWQLSDDALCDQLSAFGIF